MEMVSLLYSSRSLADVIYRQELEQLDGGNLTVHLALTREWPADWPGHRGRIDRDYLAEVVPAVAQQPLVYVCGPTAFVELIAQTFVDMGIDTGRIKTERFGPTGS